MIGQSPGLDVVLVHDWLVGVRGAERVLDRFARTYGPTDLYALVHDGRPLTPAIDACHFHVSPLQRLPGAAGRLRRWYLPVIPRMIERLRIRSCDLVLSDSSSVAKSIRPPEGVPHLCYCHSPARYIWEQTEDYATGSMGRLRVAGLRTVRRRFQDWDRRTASRVDRFLANSQHIAQRIERCWDREATVVYPPVRTSLFTPDSAVDREDWFLVVGALEPYKRTDLAIEAAVQGGHHLKVVGTGTQLESLQRSAPPGIEFLGRVPDEELIALYRRARALIFPQEEDFGIVAVEAQACGCPIIALARGGALEIVRDDTGLFVEDQRAEAFDAAMNESTRWSISSTSCRTNAERFSCEVFDQAIALEVATLVDAAMPATEVS
ncbi:MAG: glycosyltransferase [Phycisphaerales bacterium]|nr:glycosyltransferase [Phycisphaerales bacterium]